jgi:hypothetical protein
VGADDAPDRRGAGGIDVGPAGHAEIDDIVVPAAVAMARVLAPSIPLRPN